MAEMRFLCREARVCVRVRNSVIQEDPGIELPLLHTQRETAEVVRTQGRGARQVLLSPRCSAGQAARQRDNKCALAKIVTLNILNTHFLQYQYNCTSCASSLFPAESVKFKYCDKTGAT